MALATLIALVVPAAAEPPMKEKELSAEQVYRLLIEADYQITAFKVTDDANSKQRCSIRLGVIVVCLGEWSKGSKVIEQLFEVLQTDPVLSPIAIPDAITFPDIYASKLREAAEKGVDPLESWGTQVQSLATLSHFASLRIKERTTKAKQ